LPEANFARLGDDYGSKWGGRLGVVDDVGTVRMGSLPDEITSPEGRRLVVTQLRESLRWGNAPFDLLPDGGMVWTVPLMVNQLLVGGVTSYIGRKHLFPVDDDVPIVDVRTAAEELQTILERQNLTNASYLEEKRERYMSERRRAEAIHVFKTHSTDFRLAYIREEPALMACIRRGDREGARALLNNILVVLHMQAGDNLALVKSFFLEIVTLMCRTAVETGCDAGELLGKNYEAFSELSGISSDDGLGPWLHDMLERLIDAIHSHRNDSPLAQLQSALAFMHDNLHRDIGRDEVAEVAHLSPAHFSRIFKREMKESFTDMLNRMRVDHAAELLARTGRSLAVVAIDCGFKDQSYFTKVFRRYMRVTPRGYRERLSRSRSESTRRRLKQES
ncbi:MAG: AraC family transcriptional regulator, partial [Planctomycetaceae bacterium]|nr:AraC family transcriptional regulator [Planctomycetaceae bacterium]